jgi:hypothetical protein
MWHRRGSDHHDVTSSWFRPSEHPKNNATDIGI